MESVKTITKDFYCRKHPKEKILRVSSNSSNVLYCIDCVLAIADKETKETVLPIDEFIQRTVNSFEKITPQGTSLRVDPPKELLLLLDGEDEIIAKLSAHIEAEKFKVEISFGEIVQTFSTLCSSTKQQILSNLDSQIYAFRNNFRFLKRKVNKYYKNQTDNDKFTLTTEKEIVSTINKCESASDLESLIKQINEELRENMFLDSLDCRTEGVSLMLEEMKNSIRSTEDKLPRTQFSDPIELQSMIDKLEKALKDFIGGVCSIENEILELPTGLVYPHMDSKIIKNPEDVAMLKKWLSSSPSTIKFKLLVRGTRDGFNHEAFHRNCESKSNTLVLVKTEYEKVCGGFTELNWEGTGTYKEQTKAFLFSIDLKSKFTLKYPQYSIIAGKFSMPTFGGGSDLLLMNNCNQTKANYSNIGHSYNCGNFTNIDVTGGYNFTVTEYEVFEVEGYNSK